jgi:hypothetical protein
MGRLRLGATLGLLIALLIAIGCGSGSGGPNNTDGGNPAECPSARPFTGAMCDTPGLQCSYGCNVSASCDGTWTVSELGISCPADAGSS